MQTRRFSVNLRRFRMAYVRANEYPKKPNEMQYVLDRLPLGFGFSHKRLRPSVPLEINVHNLGENPVSQVFVCRIVSKKQPTTASRESNRRSVYQPRMVAR